MRLQAAPTGLADVILGTGGCLAIPAALPLVGRDRLVVMAAHLQPLAVSAAAVGEPAAECDRWWREGKRADSRLAYAILPESWSDTAVFAIAQRPGLRVLSGPPARLSPTETERWFRVAASTVPANWPRSRLLKHAYRYGPPGTEFAVELYVGLPTLNPPGTQPPVQGVAIRRVFIIGRRVLAAETYQRSSGLEERAETEPPWLTLDNWSHSETEQTVAFISTDARQSWRRLSTDVGFESINWIAQELRDGLPTDQWSLYTRH